MLKLLLAATAAGTAPGLTTASGTAETRTPLGREGSWWTHRGNAGNSGLADVAGIIADPEITWGIIDEDTIAIEDRSQHEPPLDNGFQPPTPLVTDSGLYHATHSGRIRRLDPAGAQVHWETTIDHEVRYTPTVANGRVILAGSSRLTALSVQDGSHLWTTTDIGEIHDPPAVVDDRIYLPAEEHLVPLDAATGDRRWEPPTETEQDQYIDDELREDFPSFADPFEDYTAYTKWTPVVDGDAVYISLGDTYPAMAELIDTGDGFQYEWAQDYRSGAVTTNIRNPPILQEGTLYAGGHGDTLAVAADSGDHSFSADWWGGGSLRGRLVIADGRMFGYRAAALDTDVKCYDSVTGDELWSTTLPDDEIRWGHTDSYTLTAADGVVYMAATSDTLSESAIYAFSYDGDLLWSKHLDGNVSAVTPVEHGRIAVQTVEVSYTLGDEEGDRTETLHVIDGEPFGDPPDLDSDVLTALGDAAETLIDSIENDSRIVLEDEDTDAVLSAVFDQLDMEAEAREHVETLQRGGKPDDPRTARELYHAIERIMWAGQVSQYAWWTATNSPVDPPTSEEIDAGIYDREHIDANLTLKLTHLIIRLVETIGTTLDIVGDGLQNRRTGRSTGSNTDSNGDSNPDSDGTDSAAFADAAARETAEAESFVRGAVGGDEIHGVIADIIREVRDVLQEVTGAAADIADEDPDIDEETLQDSIGEKLWVSPMQGKTDFGGSRVELDLNIEDELLAYVITAAVFQETPAEAMTPVAATVTDPDHTDPETFLEGQTGAALSRRHNLDLIEEVAIEADQSMERAIENWDSMDFGGTLHDLAEDAASGDWRFLLAAIPRWRLLSVLAQFIVAIDGIIDGVTALDRVRIHQQHALNGIADGHLQTTDQD